ncbi:serine/threonine-protein kinase Nek9-like [Physella acuta]|uniref:serine/threonine-protein kinase Nek9-like n=1 Tax=Physella acuta TaxID=109671 RepID=UPI0027DE0285|nr:serine/threonine-protein kinase Nek9-like [Physella acuta]
MFDSIPESSNLMPHRAAISEAPSDPVFLDDLGDLGQQDFSPDVMTPPRSNPSSSDVSLESRCPTWLQQQVNLRCPTWLQQELEEADFIPIPTPPSQVCDPVTSPSGESIQDLNPSKPADLKLYIPNTETETVKMLLERIAKLELENTELKKVVREQEAIIKKLGGQNS